ncbi:hypothetical protein Catovirus_1_705 [Catovirus CTV1]|uniref:Uncharacterized protein n=1 Tax=Catovirus CTV1 TaxID=1977631 RepID=A0A1V0SAA6_9VIRU|nr:hypothetical protein Catovirus_1_705 [Catovirus CTV1]
MNTYKPKQFNQTEVTFSLDDVTSKDKTFLKFVIKAANNYEGFINITGNEPHSQDYLQKMWNFVKSPASDKLRLGQVTLFRNHFEVESSVQSCGFNCSIPCNFNMEQIRRDLIQLMVEKDALTLSFGKTKVSEEKKNPSEIYFCVDGKTKVSEEKKNPGEIYFCVDGKTGVAETRQTPLEEKHKSNNKRKYLVDELCDQLCLEDNVTNNNEKIVYKNVNNQNKEHVIRKQPYCKKVEKPKVAAAPTSVPVATPARTLATPTTLYNGIPDLSKLYSNKVEKSEKSSEAFDPWRVPMVYNPTQQSLPESSRYCVGPWFQSSVEPDVPQQTKSSQFCADSCTQAMLNAVLNKNSESAKYSPDTWMKVSTEPDQKSESVEDKTVKNLKNSLNSLMESFYNSQLDTSKKPVNVNTLPTTTKEEQQSDNIDLNSIVENAINQIFNQNNKQVGVDFLSKLGF